MSIVFERTTQFYDLPSDSLERSIAEGHLLERKFDSLEEALDQKWAPGSTIAQYGFYVGTIKELFISDLPVVINEAKIHVNVKEKAIHILTAKYEDECGEILLN